MVEVKERSKTDPRGHQASTMARTISKVGIIGAGQMGNGIAHVCALSGYNVLLNDLAPDRITAALATINGNLARQVSKQRISDQDRQAHSSASRRPIRSKTSATATSSSKRPPSTKTPSARSSPRSVPT